MFDTTIGAISTPEGLGGIAVVRMSGKDAVFITSKIFRSNSGKSLVDLKGYCGILGKIFDGDTVIDEAIVFRYIAPKSYTGEDVVEISCHGGTLVTNRVLRLLIDEGATLADAGEFTKRAFLNGKMDLLKAESVMDIINANSSASLRAANNLREGLLSRKIDGIADKVLNQSAHLAAWSDYPDEDMEMVDLKVLGSVLGQVREELGALISTYDYGKILREGITTAIVGKPNVGKSTLMNILSGYETSIVSSVPGTTRDVVNQSVRLGDVVLNLSDTAGIRDTKDTVEQIGVERSIRQIETARVVLALFDNSTTLDEEDKKLIEMVKDKSVVAVINKADIPSQTDLAFLRKTFHHVVTLSAKNSEGIDRLEQAIKETLAIDHYDNDDGAVIMNERQRQALIHALHYIEEAALDLEVNMTLDAVAVSLDYGLEELLALTGKKVQDEVVGQVFAQFCVGK